jgi:dihydroorotase
MSRWQIMGGRLIDPANARDEVVDIFVQDGRVCALGEPPQGFVADHRIEAAGRLVIPGIVDLAARLRQPGEEHKASIASETAAAATAGITTLCCPPDTQPPIDTPAEVELIRRLAQAAGKARVVPLGALTAGLGGQQLSEYAALSRAGCAGLSNALAPMNNTLVLRRALEYAASRDLPVFLHPIDHALADGGCAHEGQVASRLGLPGIPEAAEVAALGQLLALVEQTGVRMHFCRLSTARAVTLVGRARYEGLPVSADVCAHQLYLTEMDIADFNALCHTQPPLRTQRDREGLRAGIAEGVVEAICSDHQPHDVDAKLAPFPATEPGISALETLLPLTLRLVDEDVLSLGAAIARLTSGPGAILGGGGRLGVGDPADLCVIDTDAEFEVDAQALVSAGKNTPFDGWGLRGRVTHTLLAGALVHGAESST